MIKFNSPRKPGDPNIWFTSDTHYNHKNICRGTSSWLSERGKGESSMQSTRDFNTLSEMNNAIVKGIHSVVKPGDILFHLGDWSFGGEASIEEFRNQILGIGVHFIFGNHDHHIERNQRYRDLFLSTKYYREISIDGQMIVMCHYAYRVWNQSHRGAWNLYGHSHGTIDKEPYGKSMDVGIDSAKKLLGEYRPFSFSEVKQIMDKRSLLLVDHHNEKTN